jgi:hypothetical protein
MHPTPPELNLIITLDAGPEIEADELDMQTRRLRGELIELGVTNASPTSAGSVPEGAKSAEAVTLGSLALVVLPTFLPKVLEYLQSWTQRDESRRVKIKTQVGDRSIELEYTPAALSQEELSHLVKTLTGAMEK